MLSRITEERLPAIPAPVDPRAFGDELSPARRHPRPDRPSL
jgi:unsaturated chondroitin disaccharide hydrolase